ncbi:FAD-binding oxidoreductase [Herbidospora yilanensis]|uniref:FAD-binding oxidoreductase n=1 Tax=Herbidospora yilanensis TaxID=354426 RepID=UPI000784CBAB|nr:FAD-binding protein [Herbidospora yilanensis]
MINDLRQVVRGRVLAAGDEGFDQAREPWDGAVDQRVLAVVEAEDAADVAAVVRHASRYGLSVATQPNGHAPSAGFEGAILLRTSRMRAVHVRPEERVARVEAGASWQEVLTAAAKHGLTGLAGSTGAVSVTGFVLGGGLSWFGRKHGFAADAVVAFEVVNAQGEHRRVTAGADPDLFWALRGGGGDYAIVTAVEIGLFPAPELFGGRIMWPAARAAEVLAAFREVTGAAPDELTVWFSLLQFPPFPELPEPLRGLSAVCLDATYLGGEEKARELLARFDTIPGAVMDTRGTMPVDRLAEICMEPTDPSPALLTSHLLTDLDDRAAATLLAATGPGTVAPLTFVTIRHLGGALAVERPDGGACGHLTEKYQVHAAGMLPWPELAGPIRERQASIARALAPCTSDRKVFTFLGHDEPADAAFPAETFARLRRIKSRRDPLGTFRSNHPVR